MKTLALFIATALAQIVGCYLPYLWLKQGKSTWLMVPAAVSLALFAWLLTMHETAAGRVYAAYGGVYIGVALIWLWAVDGTRPTASDVAGVTVALAGMGMICSSRAERLALAAFGLPVYARKSPVIVVALAAASGWGMID